MYTLMVSFGSKVPLPELCFLRTGPLLLADMVVGLFLREVLVIFIRQVSFFHCRVFTLSVLSVYVTFCCQEFH
jgi:hypothetical protein